MYLDRHPFVTSLPATAMLHTSRLSFVTRAADDDEVTDCPLKDFCEEVLPLSLQFVADLKLFSFFSRSNLSNKTLRLS
jgi:hypothetical protein